MELDEESKHALDAINFLERNKKPATREAIRLAERRAVWDADEQILVGALAHLVASDLASCVDDAYTLTKSGRTLNKYYDGQRFGAWMVKCEQSPTYRKFCAQVYGTERTHFNMMSQQQLGKLLAILNLQPGQRLLDVGCGTGAIAEHLTDSTGCQALGIDLAPAAIQRALDRTSAKRPRLDFQVMDMDELTLAANQFDVVIAIDTLYFVRDLAQTLNTLKASLRPNGQMGIFYTSKITPEQSKDLLAPNATPLTQALHANGLAFETHDFTQDEQSIWEKAVPVIQTLKSEFEAEDNLRIYESRLGEANFTLEYCRTGRTSRYLYHVRV
jgi:ubiquinone/menaquinone biosynthesis C-methylase UbiE